MMEKLITNMEELMALTGVDLLKIQEAGCVVFRTPEDISSESFKEVAEQAKKWGKGAGVNVLVLPPEIKLEIIPHGLQLSPEKFQYIVNLEARLQKLEQDVKTFLRKRY